MEGNDRKIKRIHHEMENYIRSATMHHSGFRIIGITKITTRFGGNFSKRIVYAGKGL